MEENKDGTGCIMFLKNGQKIFVLDSLRTLQKNLRLTKQLAQKLEQLNEELAKRVP